MPLAEGFLLGLPAAPWARLDPADAARLRAARFQADLVENVASLVEWVPVESLTAVLPGQYGLRVDCWGRSEGLLLPWTEADQEWNGGDPRGHRYAPISLKVTGSEAVTEVAHRLVARPEQHRFEPVASVDERGMAVGIIRVERVISRLAVLKNRAG